MAQPEPARALARLLELDRQATIHLRIAEKPGWLRSLAAVLAHSGDSWFWLTGLGIAWLLVAEAWKRPVGVAIVSTLVLAVLVLAIKFTVQRRRPEGEWGAVYRKTDPHSFPSGHAARAALLALLGLSLGPQWLGAILLIWAPLVILARVAMGVHYLSDVIAGAIIGALVGLTVVRFF